jgi:mutual gliding-motility protein MglA
MATISSINRECQLKLVYCGPSFGGKTTNIRQIHRSANPDRRGRLISLDTEEERTLLFDMLPVKGGMIEGHVVRYHFYTVPGQHYYSAIRRGVLKGADGIVFVADSSPDRLDANRASLQHLQEDAAACGVNLVSTPVVLQYNKRDVAGALPVDVLDAALNPEAHPRFESVALKGTGVFETLREVVRRAESNARRLIREELARDDVAALS